MPQSKRSSEWLALRRCLAILRRLLQGAATSDELIESVSYVVSPDAYPDEESARKRAFKRDRYNLRHRLDVEFFYDHKDGVYILQDPGPFGRFELSDNSLFALRLLSQTFEGKIGEWADIQYLLEEIIERLSPEAKRRLEADIPLIDLDVLQGVDQAELSERVWNTVNRAARQHRELAFNYLSPQQKDQKPRFHKVAPYQVRFKRGHWYLYAYDLYWRNPYGQEGYDAGHKNFRLVYIQNDDRLQVLPTKLPLEQRRPPRYQVHYRLAPAVGRGAISRHFDDMKIIRSPDGSAEVLGQTDDVWGAVRTLLAYGESCTVLGGAKVLALMRRRVNRLIRYIPLPKWRNCPPPLARGISCKWSSG
ncbi:MAG: WYL domain-containing protein [Chloroflexota bacterium]|nr:WYL domain-containing protein [Chloroflexota bacterium]